LPVVAGDCARYEPASVTLCGTIARRTYPGPPNYESVEAGDRPEVCWVLVLPRSLCVAGKEGDEVDVAEEDVREIQLVLDEEQYERYGGLVGKRACATGTLFHAITGHHFTAVLLTVKAIEERR
jgi:hypothetical protein